MLFRSVEGELKLFLRGGRFDRLGCPDSFDTCLDDVRRRDDNGDRRTLGSCIGCGRRVYKVNIDNGGKLLRE